MPGCTDLLRPKDARCVLSSFSALGVKSIKKNFGKHLGWTQRKCQEKNYADTDANMIEKQQGILYPRLK